MRRKLIAGIVVVLGLSGQVRSAQQQSGNSQADRSDQAATVASTPTASTNPPPLRAEDVRSAIVPDLNAIAEALKRIETKVEGPTFFERLRDDFISNTIWTLVTSSDSDGARIRWATSVMGLALVVLKVLYFFIGRRRAIKGEAVVNGGLWLYVAVASVLATILAASGGVPTKVVPTASVRDIEERLEGLTASVDRISGSVAAPSVQGQIPTQALEVLIDNRIAPVRSELQTVAASLTRTEQALGEVGDDAAGSAHQWFQTLLLLGLGGCAVRLLLLIHQRS